MRGVARLFFTLAIIYVILGIVLGLAMAMSNDHGEMVTHAHTMLVGWVTAALIGYFYHLFPATADRPIARFHFWLYAASTIVMLGSLLLFYGGNPSAEPGAAIGSIGFGLSMLLFAYIALPVVWKS